ncbi:MAG: hypothetical protein IJ175_05855 [Clostridia bacterium]|nr:hypothetical protein [Clostridia bacterium]
MCLTESIIPYIGIESIALYQDIIVVKQVLSNAGIRYRQEVWSSSHETVPNPWTVLIVDNILSLFFAKNNKLFKMVFWKDYQGSLPNGIHTRMQLKDARIIDPSLAFDDWNEDFESPFGYWLEDDLETGEIDSISIFIREVLDEERFDDCEW